MIKLTGVIQKPKQNEETSSGIKLAPLGETRESAAKLQIERKLAEAREIEKRIKSEKDSGEKLRLSKDHAVTVREAAEIAKEEGKRLKTEESLREYSNLVSSALDSEEHIYTQDPEKTTEYAELVEFARARFANAERYKILNDHLCAAEEYSAAVADIEEAIERAPQDQTERLIEIRDTYIHGKIDQYSKVEGFAREINSTRAELRISLEERARVIENEMRRKLREQVDVDQRREIARKLASAGAVVKKAQKIAEEMGDLLNAQKDMHVSKNLLLLAAKEFLIADGFEEVEMPKSLIKMAADAQNTESDLVKIELSNIYLEMTREYGGHGSYEESGKLFDCTKKTIETITDEAKRAEVHGKYIEGYLKIVDYIEAPIIVDKIVREYVREKVSQGKIDAKEEQTEYARIRSTGLQTVAAAWENSAMKGDRKSAFRAIQIRDSIETILQGVADLELQNRRAQNLTNRARIKEHSGQKGFEDYVCAAEVYAQIESKCTNEEAENARKAGMRSLINAAQRAPTVRDKVETSIDALELARKVNDRMSASRIFQIIKTVDPKLGAICDSASKNPFEYEISFDPQGKNFRVRKSGK